MNAHDSATNDASLACFYSSFPKEVFGAEPEPDQFFVIADNQHVFVRTSDDTKYERRSATAKRDFRNGQLDHTWYYPTEYKGAIGSTISRRNEDNATIKFEDRAYQPNGTVLYYVDLVIRKSTLRFSETHETVNSVGGQCYRVAPAPLAATSSKK